MCSTAHGVLIQALLKQSCVGFRHLRWFQKTVNRGLRFKTSHSPIFYLLQLNLAIKGFIRFQRSLMLLPSYNQDSKPKVLFLSKLILNHIYNLSNARLINPHTSTHGARDRYFFQKHAFRCGRFSFTKCLH